MNMFGKKILINSLPKSGTHLANKLVEMLGYKFSGASFSSASLYGRYSIPKSLLRGAVPGRPTVAVGLDVSAAVRRSWVVKKVSLVSQGQYIGGHVPYTGCMHKIMSDHGVKIFHVIRDPRDVLISWAHYVPKNSWHYGSAGLAGLSLEHRVEKILDGYSSRKFYIEPFENIIKTSQEWLGRESVFAIRFEDLIGPKGGGERKAQLSLIDSVGKMCGVENFDTEKLGDDLFGGTKVFRKGQIGAWSDDISSDFSSVVNERLASCVSGLGYER